MPGRWFRVTRAFLPASRSCGIATPKGFTLSSRGQGRAFCARRPRIASQSMLPTLKGSNCSAPPGPRGFPMHRYRRFHLRLLTVFPLRGTLERSNLFESHRSNQWLTLVKVIVGTGLYTLKIGPGISKSVTVSSRASRLRRRESNFDLQTFGRTVAALDGATAGFHASSHDRQTETDATGLTLSANSGR